MSDNNKTVVLYHADCVDGFGAAYAAWTALGDAATYLPVQYGQDPPAPAMEADRLYILDFSYPRPVMLDLASRSAEVVCLDHHKSAREALEGLESPKLSIIFDMDKSGAVLAWEHFRPGDPVPMLLRFVQDRDLWRWQLPRSREFSATLSIQPRDFRVWDHHAALLEDDGCRNVFCNAGAAILAARRQHVESLASKARLVEIAGHRVPAVNSPIWQSEIGERLCQLHPAAPFGAIYFDLDGEHEVWSLRSRASDPGGGFDVSAVAKQLGGGGHRNAAGFKKRRLP